MGLVYSNENIYKTLTVGRLMKFRACVFVAMRTKHEYCYSIGVRGIKKRYVRLTSIKDEAIRNKIKTTIDISFKLIFPLIYEILDENHELYRNYRLDVINMLYTIYIQNGVGFYYYAVSPAIMITYDVEKRGAYALYIKLKSIFSKFMQRVLQTIINKDHPRYYNTVSLDELAENEDGDKSDYRRISDKDRIYSQIGIDPYKKIERDMLREQFVDYLFEYPENCRISKKDFYGCLNMYFAKFYNDIRFCPTYLRKDKAFARQYTNYIIKKKICEAPKYGYTINELLAGEYNEVGATIPKLIADRLNNSKYQETDEIYISSNYLKNVEAIMSLGELANV